MNVNSVQVPVGKEGLVGLTIRTVVLLMMCALVTLLGHASKTEEFPVSVDNKCVWFTLCTASIIVIRERKIPAMEVNFDCAILL